MTTAAAIQDMHKNKYMHGEIKNTKPRAVQNVEGRIVTMLARRSSWQQ